MALSLHPAALPFAPPAAALAPATRSSVSMKAPGEIGVTPPLGVYDPLNLLATPVTYPRRSYERYVELEIKHGRIAMLACLGVITTEAGIRWPGYLSKSLDLKFEDRKVVTIKDFDIYRFLGAGGFGMVLLAEKVKTSHNHLTDSRHNGN